MQYILMNKYCQILPGKICLLVLSLETKSPSLHRVTIGMIHKHCNQICSSVQRLLHQRCLKRVRYLD